MMKITFEKSLLIIVAICFCFNTIAQTEGQRKQIVKDYDLVQLKDLETKLSKKYFSNKKKAINLANVNKWPETIIKEDGRYLELMYISEEGTPIYYSTNNAGAAITARVNRINEGGSAGLKLDGQNMIVGIWEPGTIRTTHQDIFGRVVIKDGSSFASSTGITEHATHVSGTMIGSGFGSSRAKGLASKATLWANTFANDKSEATAQAAEGLLVSNHSYGLVIETVPKYYLGAYISESKEWDDIMFNAPYYQAVFAAGNDRGSTPDIKGGRDLLTGAANSKNAVVVAAVNQVSNYTGPESVTMSSFSSWGPTDDFRIKPDISTKGVAVYSLSSSSDTSYQSLQGTSMAAPGVSASLLLMQQYYNERFSSFMRAATLRALMINSADEAGDDPGPDYRFGWGLINAEKAVQIIEAKGSTSVLDELTLSEGQTYTRTLNATGTKPLNVTVVWNDPSGNVNSGTIDDATPVLVNDLDIRVTKDTEVNYPWLLDPSFIQGPAIQEDNSVDNVEYVSVPEANGVYTLTISHKGNLVGGSQDFSLVIDGVTEPLSVIKNEFKSLSVFPNPVDNNLNIQLASESNEKFDLRLFDIQGRLIENNIFSDNSYTLNANLDMSSFAPGIYLLKIIQGTKYYTQKINVK